MDPLHLYPGSKFTILVDLRDDLALADLTTDTVQFAFTESGTPEDADWTEGTWVETMDGSRVVTNAAIVVDHEADNPGDVSLEAGTYRIWVQVLDNPDTPVLRNERLLVVG